MRGDIRAVSDASVLSAADRNGLDPGGTGQSPTLRRCAVETYTVQDTVGRGGVCDSWPCCARRSDGACCILHTRSLIGRQAERGLVEAQIGRRHSHVGSLSLQP